jgi:hypothetical protein
MLNRFPRALVVKYIVAVLKLSEGTYRYHVRMGHVPVARHRLADDVPGPANYYTVEEAQEVIEFFAKRDMWDKAEVKYKGSQV